MSNIEWFFNHTALIGVSVAVLLAFVFTLLKISDLKKFDYSILALSILVAVANHNF